MSGLTALPSALADATPPPSGKYYNVVEDEVVWYSQTTGTIWDLEETVDPYDCPYPEQWWIQYWAEDDPIQCGNCEYQPEDGSGTWKLASTAYTVGRCISLDPNDDYVLADTLGVTALRVDVRLMHQSAVEKYRWSASIRVTGDGLDYGPYGDIVLECWPVDCDPHDCAHETTLLGTVHHCGEGPQDVDLRDRPWFEHFEQGGDGRMCTYVVIEKFDGSAWRVDSDAVVCEFAW